LFDRQAEKDTRSCRPAGHARCLTKAPDTEIKLVVV
jgi:hypothetical protein